MTVWYCQRDLDQRDRVENIKTDSHRCSQLIADKCTKAIQGKGQSLQ